MAGSWPKLIRDPIHDLISFEKNDCDKLLLGLINTREFQRLRRIKQLGMSEMVFPGGNHSRFAHSIGVMHNARRFLDRLGRLMGKPYGDEIRIPVLAAALLHDLGHGPFSHAFEKITEDKHERRTVEIITDSSTEVHARLCEVDPELPQRLKQFYDEPEEGAASVPRYLVQIVSSQLDADRFDYLLRDAHATGAEYGRFDTRWLIQHLVPNLEKDRLELSNKAFVAAETYIFARYHMYRAVYFHKATRAAEVMLKLLFQRYRTLVRNDRTVIPGVSSAFVDAFASDGSIPLADYLLLDDHSVTEFLKLAKGVADPTLSHLASGILDRKLYKAVDVTDATRSSTVKFVTAVHEHCRTSGRDPDASLIEDSASDTAYKPYDPDKNKPNTMIYIEDGLGHPCEFGELSKSVDALKKKYALVRYYFPSDSREVVDGLANQTLKKE